MVLYTEKSSPDDPDLNRMCQAFSEDDSVESIWILQGGYEAFLSYYGSRVCQLEDDSVIYPGATPAVPRVPQIFPVFVGFSGAPLPRPRLVDPIDLHIQPLWYLTWAIMSLLFILSAHIDDTYQIYLSGEYVSKQRQVFVDLGITYVLLFRMNCFAFIFPNT